MGTATVLNGALSARVSMEDVDAFAEHVAILFRAPPERARLAAAGPTDAAAWSAPVLMEKVVALYRHLGQVRVPGRSGELPAGDSAM